MQRIPLGSEYDIASARCKEHSPSVASEIPTTSGSYRAPSDPVWSAYLSSRDQMRMVFGLVRMSEMLRICVMKE
jgi:hypothetical protein